MSHRVTGENFFISEKKEPLNFKVILIYGYIREKNLYNKLHGTK